MTIALAVSEATHDQRQGVLARLDSNQTGMFYDLDAAILAAFGVDDDDFTLTYDQEGVFRARVNVHRRYRSLSELTRAFYRFWASVSLDWCEISRNVMQEEVTFCFRTRSGTLDYRGEITFAGDSVRRIAAPYRRRAD
jgi:hypothetical protein